MKQSAFLVLFFISTFTFSQTLQSPLATGDWYKISVVETGVHRITYNDLVSYGLDPTTIDPKNIVLFGMPAGMLSETFSEGDQPMTSELAIFVEGEDDGTFDPSDYILFYGQSPVSWGYDSAKMQYRHQLNFYTDETYYFLSVGESPGKRILAQESVITPYTAIINYFDLLIYHEVDSVNPGKKGKQWLGEAFHENNVLSYEFDLSNYLIEPYITYFNTVLAANSSEISTFDIMINDAEYADVEVYNIPENQFFLLYKQTTFDTTGFVIDGDLNLLFTYDQPNDSSLAWLDYFEFRLKSAPYLISDQLSFRSAENVGMDSVSHFYFQNTLMDDLKVWNVSDPMNVTNIVLQQNPADQPWFQLETEEILEFQAFNGLSYIEPVFIEKIENQDLSGMETPEYLIITHPDFVVEAEQLKTIHESDLTTRVVVTESIYNEYAAGIADISAIRNFIWELYEMSGDDTLKYVALLGDASYDYKNRVAENSNFIPTYQSRSSGNEVQSYATDRFYAVKDMFESDQHQLALGRIPVSSEEEASNLISKIDAYKTANSLGSWKNEMMFIADDGDANLHMAQAEILSESSAENSHVFNHTKTYLDFFELIQSDDGPQYPEVNAEIEEKINNGVFYVNYTGHGGRSALAQEQVVTIPDMDNWYNEDRMPLWVIGSASVARYDDPSFTSLAESLLLKTGGGAISVISSSGHNFANANLMLNSQILDIFSNESVQQSLRFGDLFTIPISGNNDLKWVLLGDPALKISFPEFGIETLKLNDVDVELFEDTIRPGSSMKINGHIVDKADGLLQSWFDGNVYLKVYSPIYTKSTRSNQGTPIMDVPVQDSILAISEAVVEAGQFELFVDFPSEYYEDFGQLKFSWYAHTDDTDASGYFDDIVYGGLPTDIDEFDQMSEKIKVFPSPFDEKLTIELPETENGRFLISVYNMMGDRVYMGETPHKSKSENLNLGFLTNGIYLVHVSNQFGTKSFKVIKQ